MTMSVDNHITEVHYDPDCPAEQVSQVLSALERWSGRTARHVTHQRTSDRHDYRSTVIIEAGGDASAGGAVKRQVFYVQTRNVSKAGLGFIAPPVFMPRVLSDTTPLLLTEVVFQVGTRMKVQLGPPTGNIPTLSAVVTRLRPVHFGFFDVGVRFLARN
jgi:hypothetical protein